MNSQGKVIAQEQYSYTGTDMIIRQKDLVDNKGHIFHQTIFGREPQSLSYIEWVFGVDSVKKWNDRFTTSNLNELDKPNEYRFFDVDAYEYKLQMDKPWLDYYNNETQIKVIDNDTDINK